MVGKRIKLSRYQFLDSVYESGFSIYISFMNYFSHNFLKINGYTFFMLSTHVLNVYLYLNITLLTSICSITYVPRWFQVRVLILNFSFKNYFSRSALTNYSIHIFLCHQIMFWMPFSNFLMIHFLPLFVKLLAFSLVSNWWPRDDLLPIDSNTLPLCHGRRRTCIHIFIFKFA